MLAPLAGYKTYIAAVLAVLGALAGALDGDMTWQQAAAVITPAIIGAALRHGFSTSITALISAIVDALAKAADQMGKKSGTILLAGIVLGALALTACTGPTNPEDTLTEGDPLVFAYRVACGAYSDSRAPLAVAVQMGLFDTAGQKALAEGTAVADQICNGPTPPKDINAAIAKVNEVAAAVLIAVAQAHGKLPPAALRS
jgi:hypothetical protein